MTRLRTDDESGYGRRQHSAGAVNVLRDRHGGNRSLEET